MVKLLGAGMVLSGCFGLGMWYRSQFFGRIKALNKLAEILELLAGEVRYGRSTLPECCLHIAGYLDTSFSEAFGRIGHRMAENTGLSFGEIFTEEINFLLEDQPIKSEEKEIFLRFAVQTGFVDGQMQLRTLEQSGDCLRQTVARLEKENAEKCRMAVGLGTMSGLLLLLILW